MISYLLPRPRTGLRSRVLLLTSLFLSVAAATTAGAQPTATSPYAVSVFAQSPAGASQPDSIVQWHDSIIVGFQNHVAKDGTDGKSSTIVEFSRAGKVKRTFTVPGHNDGLRVIDGDLLWALQNEDANPNLVVIDLRTGIQTRYQFAPTPHGGGYDDIVVEHGRVYLTASNPNLDSNGINVFPALVRATLSGTSVILQPLLNGNANATDLRSGKTVSLNLTDPDSMTLDPSGNIVFVSQADSLLVFVRHPGRSDQAVGVLPLSSSVTGPNEALITIDDTSFAPDSNASLLVTDVNAGVIYRIDRTVLGARGFEPGRAYSASDTLGLVGTLNVDNGFITPIVTGFGSARGLLFLSADRTRDREADDD
jgi:hypothetical protein